MFDCNAVFSWFQFSVGRVTAARWTAGPRSFVVTFVSRHLEFSLFLLTVQCLFFGRALDDFVYYSSRLSKFCSSRETVHSEKIT